MAALPILNPTLLDLSKRMDPTGKIDTIVEMLNETNEVLEDMSFLEGNLLTGNRSTIRTGLPGVTWRKLYQGVQPGKSTTVQITDNCGMLEAYAEVDKKLVELNGNSPAFRLSEDRAFIEAMNKEFVQTLFYGNEGTEPEAFTGLTPRFNSKTAENAGNLLDGGGLNGQIDCQSIWLCVWGPNTGHGIIPKGTTAGLKATDLGEITAGDATNGYWQALRSHYTWDVGLTVRDWRYFVRIHSIDMGLLTKNAASGADLIDLMARALEIPPSLKLGRAVFYCSRSMKAWLRRQIVNKVVGSTLTMEQVAGKHVMTFDGIPVKRVDQLIDESSLN